MSNIKEKLSKNLANLRKNKNLTQLELATMLNYSDKSVSKWECGDALPDIEILNTIAQFYGVTLDYLVNGVEPPSQKAKTPLVKGNYSNKVIITLLAASIVWFCATLVQTQIRIASDYNAWIAYVWAAPATFIVFVVFNAIWGQSRFSLTLVSCLVWTLLAALYLQFLSYNIWMIFFIGIPVQVAAILWAQLLKNRKMQKKAQDG